MAKRLTFWEDILINTSLANAGQAGFDLLGSTGEAESRGYTLTRIILYLEFYNGTYAGISGRQQVSLGMGMIERDAASALEFPDPHVAADAPGRGWLYRNSRTVLSELDQANSGWPYVTMEADLRGQRKVLYAKPMAIFHNNNLDGVGFAVRLFGWIRCLYKLP